MAIDKVPYADYIYFMTYTGYRPSEMFALTKASYDDKNNCLVGGSKTEAGKNRIVTISPKIQGILNKQLSSEGDFLFPAKKGKQMTDSYFRAWCFYPCMKALGIENRVPYSCRHTFANLMKNVAGSDTDKASLIGHANASMTKYYQSADIDSLKKITDVI